MIPPNITAWSSSVIVREKLEQGGDLDPLLDGEYHNPGIEKYVHCTKIGMTILKKNPDKMAVTSIM